MPFCQPDVSPLYVMLEFNTAGPIGSYNPDPLHPASRMGDDDGYAARIKNYPHNSNHNPDVVAATPNYKPCVPCGPGYSTRATQSSSAKDCLADCPCGEHRRARVMGPQRVC